MLYWGKLFFHDVLFCMGWNKSLKAPQCCSADTGSLMSSLMSLISALPLNVVALPLPPFCLLVACSFVQLAHVCAAERTGWTSHGTDPAANEPDDVFSFLSQKNNPQKLCLWSCEYVCVFLVLFSFFLVPHGQELFTWRISGKNPALILSSGIMGCFFFACSKYKWILLFVFNVPFVLFKG